MEPGIFQADFLVQHAEEFWDGEVASGIQGHGSDVVGWNRTTSGTSDRRKGGCLMLETDKGHKRQVAA